MTTMAPSNLQAGFDVAKLSRYGASHIVLKLGSMSQTVCGLAVPPKRRRIIRDPDLCVRCKNSSGEPIVEKAKERINEKMEAGEK